eukprot:4103765-Pyramimonas_sp.AAC.1
MGVSNQEALSGPSKRTRDLRDRFLQALEAESAHYEGVPRFTAAVLWDLSNYYEHINRDKWFSRAVGT